MSKFNSAITTFYTQHIQSWFNFDTLLSATPPQEWPYKNVYIGFIAFCLLGAIVVLIWRSLYPVLRERLGLLFWTNVILGPILYFFRFQQIPVLGMDFIRTIQEIAFAIWLIVIILRTYKEYPKEKFEEKLTERRNKYLPKPKNTL